MIQQLFSSPSLININLKKNIVQTLFVDVLDVYCLPLNICPKSPWTLQSSAQDLQSLVFLLVQLTRGLSGEPPSSTVVPRPSSPGPWCPGTKCQPSCHNASCWQLLEPSSMESQPWCVFVHFPGYLHKIQSLLFSPFHQFRVKCCQTKIRSKSNNL